MRTILVLPGGTPLALRYRHHACLFGDRLVGASSVADDPARALYPDWTYLPRYTEDDFAQALRQAVDAHGITHLFCTHYSLWRYLKEALPALVPGVVLNQTDPLELDFAPYAELEARASDLAPADADEAAWLTAVIKHAEAIPGQFSEAKLKALLAAARDLPQGDVVEIGSLFGRSAFVLLMIARRFGIGKVLCVDPWAEVSREQSHSTAEADDVARTMDFNRAFEMFQTNLKPYANSDLNVLRMPSEKGYRAFSDDPTVDSRQFGHTQFQGAIACLHIDGNHDYPVVSEDLATWPTLVRPGGLIIVDDYDWAFGDGPKRAADRFLARETDRIAKTWVTDGALFVRLS